MFLSDELLQIGINANPKNNLSQSIQCQKMLDVLNKEKSNGCDLKKLYNTTNFVVKILNKKGFNFYTIDVFWATKTSKSSQKIKE